MTINFENLLDNVIWFWLPVLISFVSIALIILFYIHRRNNKRHLFELQQKIEHLIHHPNHQEEKQFEVFKQGLQQLISELNQRVKNNEQRTLKILHQLEELQYYIHNQDENNEAIDPSESSKSEV